MKKKKKFPMKRKTKAIIGIIICLILVAANIALSGYTWTKEEALNELMEYNATGEMNTVSTLPRLGIKNKPNYCFYLLENETCFAMFSISHYFWYGWLDGPSLIVEKDSTKPVIFAINSYQSDDDKHKEMIRVFGLINDAEISRVEAEICFATAGGEQTLTNVVIKTEKFMENGEERYFCMDYICVDKLPEYMMPPFEVKGYNDAGELVCTEEFTYSQSTSIG